MRNINPTTGTLPLLLTTLGLALTTPAALAQSTNSPSLVRGEASNTAAMPCAPSTTLNDIKAESGAISSPFVITNGCVCQPLQTTLTDSGRATYTFPITNDGDYIIRAIVDSPSGSPGSFYVNVDGEPQDPTMIWDLPPTTGVANCIVSWRGKGTLGSAEPVRKIFKLSAGVHQLIIRGRSANTRLHKFSIGQLPSPPQNLHPVQVPQSDQRAQVSP